ncbi:MAG: GxGYxYP family putative glycoside hydrolase [Oscillospiraceae bacterium]|nr:GxGYxYP family putative glycoside hydrolase [Oscillospiraceae bacterium]MDD4413529.1 GxGYxYP family putative glycoside hydrolase [Oscillospiraceae bacterium]
MKRQRIVSLFSVIIIILSLFVGCGGTGNDTSGGKKAPGETQKGDSTTQSGYSSNDEVTWGTDAFGSTITGINTSTNGQTPGGSSNQNPGGNGNKTNPDGSSIYGSTTVGSGGTTGTTKPPVKPREIYHVYINDMMLQNISDREKYDQFTFVTSLQGSINRNNPSIFTEWDMEVDRFWFDYITGAGKPFNGVKRNIIGTFEKFVDTFLNEIKQRGLVVWDKNVPSTSNVAATACSVDGYLPVRYETDSKSVYQMLTKEYNIPVKLNLVGKFTGNGTIPDTNRQSSSSTKCDAYIWAIEKYMDKTSDEYMAYYLDAATWGSDTKNPSYSNFRNTGLPNRDYAVARKAFFFDLSSWGDEKPCDDPNQPLGTDLKTLKEILQRQYNKSGGKKITQISGYTPWQIKYTTWQNKGKHDGVPTEWELTEIISAYNCVLDADSADYSQLSNASFYMHYPLKNSYTNSKPLVANPVNNKNKKYVYIYMGDYDSAAWLTKFVPKMFTDKNRGKIPLAWPFNPNLSKRVPMVFDYVYENKTTRDFFTSGDSGAGYLNPSLLLAGQRQHSNNPSGMDAWISWNKTFYNKFDLSITGFLLNGSNNIPDEVFDAYLQFSPNGIMVNRSVDKYSPRVYKGMPLVINALDIAHDNKSIQKPAGTLNENAVNTADRILSQISSTSTNTYAFRTILCTPTFMYEVYKKVRAKNSNVEFVDPYTFFEMVKQQ